MRNVPPNTVLGSRGGANGYGVNAGKDQDVNRVWPASIRFAAVDGGGRLNLAFDRKEGVGMIQYGVGLKMGVKVKSQLLSFVPSAESLADETEPTIGLESGVRDGS